MTRFEPTLIVTRLVVERNRVIVYNEAFHEGVNVIRGENSSGKSTILNFIFYGLGGDLADWSETALLCSRVIVEVRINGNAATLSRDISGQTGQPMEIFGGSYEESLAAPRAEWIKYPYRRTPSLESFSQALFRLLGLPEVVSDATGNLTMHQILRLLYADQLSPIENLFRYETRFDPPILRDAIGRLLCGAYDSALYQNDVKIRELTRAFDTANGELSSLFAVVGKTGHSLTVQWLDAQRSSLQAELGEAQNQVATTERELFTSAGHDQLTLSAQEDAYNEVQRLQSELEKTQRDHDALVLAIADSAAFINSLDSKIAALHDSSAVAEHFGEVVFGICPACFATIDRTQTRTPESCYLCTTPFSAGRATDRITAMINDAAIQLKQSNQLQKDREERLGTVRSTLHRLQGQWRGASARLVSLRRLPSTELQSRLRALQRQVGYLERQLEDLDKQGELIRLIDEKSRLKNDLNSRINKLKDENARLQTQQERRLTHARHLIEDEVRTLLRNDLRREESFENAERIEFDFATNRITVDGHSYFSASSRVILKSSFFLGFFAAATKDPHFRHPRFVMIDTTEDKGMEVQRSQNFQNQILRVSRDAKVEHQIIYATSMISSDLDEDAYHVGRFSTRDDHTLAIK